MRAPAYFILAALFDGPLHGYGIIKHAEELSAGQVSLAAGTLYAALDRLSEAGLVTAEREEIVNGRARRYYALTDSGEAVLREEAQRLAAAANVVIGRRRRRPTLRSVTGPALRAANATVRLA